MKLSWRRPRLLLSAVVAAGALSGLTVAAAPAYAAGPHITVIGGPGEILVQGGGFNADASVRIEALTPGLSKVLETIYVTANWIGYLDGDIYLNNLGGCLGTTHVAADGAPGPTAWATTHVSGAPFLMVSGRTPPYCDGTVDVFGYNFQPGATVQVKLVFGFLVMDTFYATVNQYGGIWYPYTLSLTPGYDGPAWVVATEYYPYGQTASAFLSEAC
jgi:hypothetical protein